MPISDTILERQRQGLLFGPGTVTSERHLVGIAAALGAEKVRGCSTAERRLLASAEAPSPAELKSIRTSIREGQDPLGDAFCLLRSSAERRNDGATYTPSALVEPMLAWCEDHGKPSAVVDPGAGSARFLIAAARTFPAATLVGIELDPLAALIARANLAQCGFANRSEVILADYRSVDLSKVLASGPALYVGNPPYVRHHQISPAWKEWLSREGAGLDLDTSNLAGLHVHFFVATAKRLRRGDYGCFVTSAEWLDVNYGRMVRQLFLSRLGGTRLVLIEPRTEPFPDATTTGAITCFEAEARPKSIFVQRVEAIGELHRLGGQRRVVRERLESESRWSHLTRKSEPIPNGFVELGELCRVHRGQVTGANDVWIADTEKFKLPRSVLYRTVTRARELFSAGLELADSGQLKHVVDLPVDLDGFRETLTPDDRRSVDSFLRYAKAQGAHEGYVAKSRKAWWAVGLREPAPILATYMARRPPAFVQNKGQARHLNIAHGLYPREKFSSRVMRSLVEFLASAVKLTSGRTYAGGLTKFEPREMERILVPDPQMLEHASFA